MERTGIQRPGPTWTNERWLASLRGETDGADLAHTELRDRVAKALRKATARFGPDDSTLEDLTQIALLRILEKLDRFEGRSRFTTWAYSVALHAAFGELRRNQGAARYSATRELQSDSEAADLIDDRADPTAPARKREIVATLHRIIEDQLTEKQRQAVLSELRDTPLAELESELGSNRNALHKLLHDARKKLRQGLEAAGFTDSDVRLAFDL